MATLLYISRLPKTTQKKRDCYIQQTRLNAFIKVLEGLIKQEEHSPMNNQN